MKKRLYSKNILLIDHLLAHYRRDVYDLLDKDTNFNFDFVSGKEYLGVKSIDICGRQNFHTYKYYSFKLFHHQFFFSFGILRYYFTHSRQRIICTGVDFHLIHTIIIFLIHRIILRRKFYWWTHGNDGNQGNLGVNVRRFVYKNSTGILAYSNAGKLNLVKMGVAADRICVVNNSLNNEDYGYLMYNLNESRNSEVFNIIYSGRITSEKRLDFLMKAIYTLKQRSTFKFKCLIIGSGEISSLKGLVKHFNIENEICFLGSKYGKEVDPYFLNSNLMVYPSGIGLSIVHAFSYGIPVVTTDNLKLHRPEFELLEAGENGDLYKEDDDVDLAEKIIKWHDLIINNRNQIIDNCIDSIKKHNYFPQGMKDAIVNFLLKV